VLLKQKTTLLLVIATVTSISLASSDGFLDYVESLVNTNQCEHAVEVLLADERSASELDDPKRQSILYFQARGCIVKDEADYQAMLENRDALVDMYQLRGNELDTVNAVVDKANKRVHGGLHSILLWLTAVFAVTSAGLVVWRRRNH
jgi:hypothetical protein